MPIRTMSLLLLLASVAFLAAADLSRAEPTESPWPTFKHDPQRTGQSVVNGPSIPEVRWTFKTGNPIGYASPAVDAQGTIYIGSSDSHFYAINPDGSEKWRYRTGDWVESSPAIGPGGTI
jgi:hypothetical protein